MKLSKSNKLIKSVILCFVFLFILANIFNKNNAATFIVETNDPFFPNDQTVTGPGFFPFSNSQGAVDLFNQQCPDPTFVFDGPNSLFGSTLEVGPAANNAETGNRVVLIFDMDGNAAIDFVDPFPLTDPFTMTVFDPSMGDILGLSFVPGMDFPGSAAFMITTTFNCDNGATSTSSTSTSSSSSSSSGQSVSTSSSSGSLTNPQIISRAIDLEKSAKASVDIKNHLKNGTPLSVSMALDDIKSSLTDLQNLQSQFQGDNDIMLGMSTLGMELTDAINAENEAIMTLEPLKDTDPNLANSEFTTGLTKAKRLISQALRIKELVSKKLIKLDAKK